MDKQTSPKTVRCAIYTRKSTNEGADQDFTSLDSQRESAENYIASQKNQGWITLPDRYDDYGFTGLTFNYEFLNNFDSAKIEGSIYKNPVAISSGSTKQLVFHHFIDKIPATARI